MASVFITVFEGANNTALGNPVQYIVATIDGAATEIVNSTFTAKQKLTCRIMADADCFLSWGASPAATDGTDAIPFGAENPEYHSVEAGHKFIAITRA